MNAEPYLYNMASRRALEKVGAIHELLEKVGAIHELLEKVGAIHELPLP